MKPFINTGVIILSCCLLKLDASAQYVGIGTTTPTQRLDVNGNLNVKGKIFISDSALLNGHVKIAGITYLTGSMGIGTAVPLQKLDVNGNAHLSGSLGIGRLMPLQKLDVNGSATISGNLGVGILFPLEKLMVDGGIRIGSGGYTGITNNAASPIPAGGPGTMVFLNGNFYGWTGAVWKQLNN
jgi:hypothetical protein